jgi:hypothetical protein
MAYSSTADACTHPPAAPLALRYITACCTPAERCLHTCSCAHGHTKHDIMLKDFVKAVQVRPLGCVVGVLSLLTLRVSSSGGYRR